MGTRVLAFVFRWSGTTRGARDLTFGCRFCLSQVQGIDQDSVAPHPFGDCLGSEIVDVYSHRCQFAIEGGLCSCLAARKGTGQGLPD